MHFQYLYCNVVLKSSVQTRSSTNHFVYTSVQHSSESNMFPVPVFTNAIMGPLERPDYTRTSREMDEKLTLLIIIVGYSGSIGDHPCIT